MLAHGGWGLTPSQRAHTIGEFQTLVQSLHNSQNIPRWLLELIDFIEDHQEEFNPWFLNSPAGKLTFPNIISRRRVACQVIGLPLEMR